MPFIFFYIFLKHSITSVLAGKSVFISPFNILWFLIKLPPHYRPIFTAKTMEDFKFTDSRLQKIGNNSKKIIEIKDLSCKGLQLRISPNGRKIFRLRIWDSKRKREIRETLGGYPQLSISLARDIVREKYARIIKGDSDEVALAERITLDEAAASWIETYAMQNLKRWQEEERRYARYISPHLGRKIVADITPEMIEVWRDKLLKQKKERGGDTLSKGMVNRAQITLSSILGKVCLSGKNPASRVKKFPAKRRNVFLKSQDLELFFAQIEKPETPELLRDYLLLSIYTGARKSNVLAMKWEDIDLQLGIWIIQEEESKNKDSMIVPLTKQAVDILKERRKNKISQWVLPSPRKKGEHLAEPRRLWHKFLDESGLGRSFRLHDLRRTLGSWQAITGSSLQIIGSSLGHKSTQSTEAYAHLIIDPVREAMQRAADAIPLC